MVNNIELRREYVRLVQQGKTQEAFAKLQEIWSVESGKKPVIVKAIKKAKKPVKKVVEDKVPEKKSIGIDSIKKIKGIGKETFKDIKSLYPTMEDLMSALASSGGIPMRNDIEKKLRKALLNN